jgi:DNA modification methylase
MMIPARVALALQADGWYLRSDIIWAKPNPMPESVTDRPTTAHEHLFLLSKSERYYYDAAAIAEPVSGAMLDQMEQGYDGFGLKDYEAAGVQNPSSVKARIIANAQRKNEQSGDRRKVGFNDRWDASEATRSRRDSFKRDGSKREQTIPGQGYGTHRPNREESNYSLLTRNKRTVWTIPTMPCAGAHFATMPEALVEPCILAGCPIGGLVFDPFIGSGTVGAVAERLGRRWVGTDLSYQDLAQERTAQRGIQFEAVI